MSTDLDSGSSGASDVGDAAGAAGVSRRLPPPPRIVPLVLGPIVPIVRRYPFALPTWDSPDSASSSCSPPDSSSFGLTSLPPLPRYTVPIPAQVVLDHHVLAYSAFAASTGVPAYPVSRSSVLAYLRHASLLPSWSSRAAPRVLTALRRSCRLQNLTWLSAGAARALRTFSAPSPHHPPPPPAPLSHSWTSHPEPWVELTILDYDHATSHDSARDTAAPSPDVAYSSPRRSCTPSPPSSSPIANGPDWNDHQPSPHVSRSPSPPTSPSSAAESPDAATIWRMYLDCHEEARSDFSPPVQLALRLLPRRPSRCPSRSVASTSFANCLSYWPRSCPAHALQSATSRSCTSEPA